MPVEIAPDLSVNPNQVDSVSISKTEKFKTDVTMRSGIVWKITTSYEKVCEFLAVAKMGWIDSE